MMRPDPRVKAVYLYSKPVDFRKSINGLAALVELDIKVAVFGGHPRTARARTDLRMRLPQAGDW